MGWPSTPLPEQTGLEQRVPLCQGPAWSRNTEGLCAVIFSVLRGNFYIAVADARGELIL